LGTKNALQDRQVETIDDLRQLEVISRTPCG
jgi:hypothetical protein